MPFRLSPTYIVEHVTDINLDDLKSEGITGLLFDLDNTLMAPKSAILTADVSQWLDMVRNDFKIAILSNNPHMHYIEIAAEQIGCSAYGKADKPRRAVALKALKDLEMLPSQVAIIGDRPLTDILVGQRLGLYTILVDPLIKNEESRLIKLLRKLERLFIKSPKKVFSEKNNSSESDN